MIAAQLHVESLTFETAPSATQWNRLLAASSANVVFLTRQYQEAWWRVFGQADDCCPCTLHILTFREGDNLVGLAPFYLAASTPADQAEEQERTPGMLRAQARAARQTGAEAPTDSLLPAPRLGERVLRLVGGVAVTDYLDILALPGYADAVWAAIFDYWADRREQWDVLDLRSLPPDSPACRAVPRLAAARRWAHWAAIEETAPQVALVGDWETYLAGLNKKDRHELRRKLRKAESAEAPVTWRLVRDPAALPAALEQFIALHRQSDADKAAFMDPRMEGFFQQLVAAMAEPGWVEVALLDVAGQPAAAYLSFAYNGRIYLYNSGYDPRLRELSGGLILLARRIEAALQEGIATFDFLRGDERYKYDLGGQDYFIYRLLVRPTAHGVRTGSLV